MFQEEMQTSYIVVTNPNPCRVHIWRHRECLHTLEPQDTITVPIFAGLRVSAEAKRSVLVFEHVGFDPWLQRVGLNMVEPDESLAIKNIATKEAAK